MNAIRVALIDDQLLFRQGIASMIQNTDKLELCFEAENGIACLNRLETLEVLPDVVLVDMEMPEMDGMQLTEQLQLLYPTIKILMLSVYDNQRLIAHMIQAGACGYLIKNCDKEELITAIITAHSSGFYINASALKAIQTASSKASSVKNNGGIPIEISHREKEVLEMICQELTNAEIGEKLFVSVRTVEGHRNNLLAKTGCRNTAGLVLFAIKNHFHTVLF
jgi:DNA-binding NarL/FixJ family response regulator